MDQSIWFFILVGFVAQSIDGALGMAYGVSSNSLLLSLGIPPAAASASVHAAKIFTTAVSGISHLGFGNVDKGMLKRLIIPGMVGGILGVIVLSVVPEDIIKPIVAIYLFVMGIVILRKVISKGEPKWQPTRITPLGLIGGFFDGIGGGGWGPIVTSTLVARGRKPRFAIGTVNLAEFFVSIAQSIAFVLTIGFTHWQIIIGLIIGGVIAAPLAAMVTKKLPSRALMNMVGIVIIMLSIRTIYVTFW